MTGRWRTAVLWAEHANAETGTVVGILSSLGQYLDDIGETIAADAVHDVLVRRAGCVPTRPDEVRVEWAGSHPWREARVGILLDGGTPTAGRMMYERWIDPDLRARRLEAARASLAEQAEHDVP